MTFGGRTLTVFALTSALAILAVTSGCGAGSSSSSSGSDPSDAAVTHTSTGRSGTAPSALSRHTDQVPRTDLRNEKPIQWRGHQVLDDRRIRVLFTMASPDCFGVRASVTETDRTVAITVHQGSLPNGPEICTADGALGALVVTTAQPVGNRAIIS